MNRLIFHIDVNSAFLSWESARRVKEGLPDLRDIPACIGGDPKKRTGIVVAKSIPAKKFGIQTGEPVAMAHSSEAEIQRLLGNKAGHQLYQYACGIDDSPVRAQPEEAKGFSVETTFNDDIVSVEQVLPILLEQCDIVATRMRRKEKKCTSISVNFRTLDFRNKSHQMTLPNATDTTDEIYKNAQKLFAESWKGEPLRLIGVALTNLTDESFEQLSLFEDNEKKERRRKLDATMDEIRKKFGNDKITRASIMNSSTGIAKKARAQMKNEDDKESRTVE